MFDWAKRKNLATYLITRFYESGAKRVRTADLLTASHNITPYKLFYYSCLHFYSSKLSSNFYRESVSDSLISENKCSIELPISPTLFYLK